MCKCALCEGRWGAGEDGALSLSAAADVCGGGGFRQRRRRRRLWADPMALRPSGRRTTRRSADGGAARRTDSELQLRTAPGECRGSRPPSRLSWPAPSVPQTSKMPAISHPSSTWPIGWHSSASFPFGLISRLASYVPLTNTHIVNDFCDHSDSRYDLYLSNVFVSRLFAGASGEFRASTAALCCRAAGRARGVWERRPRRASREPEQELTAAVPCFYCSQTSVRVRADRAAPGRAVRPPTAGHWPVLWHASSLPLSPPRPPCLSPPVRAAV